MALLPIYNCFHPALRERTKKIENITDDVVNLAVSMLQSMYNADGIGLAANQVGEKISIIVVDENSSDEDEDKRSPIVMINPVVLNVSDETSDYKEGCLSIPTFYEYVTRPSEIEFRYFDLDMKEVKRTAGGLLSRVVQHEIDHLNGILFTDRISPIKKAMAKGKLNKIKEGDYQVKYHMINFDGSLKK